MVQAEGRGCAPLRLLAAVLMPHNLTLTPVHLVWCLDAVWPSTFDMPELKLHCLPATLPLMQACGLPEQYVPNMLLAVLWASQANAVPAAFWSLGFLLLPENRRHLQAVVQEAQQAVTAGTDTPEPAADNAQLLPAHRQHATVKGLPPLLTDEQQRGLVALAAKRRSAAAAAVAEALRLRSFRCGCCLPGSGTVGGDAALCLCLIMGGRLWPRLG